MFFQRSGFLVAWIPDHATLKKKVIFLMRCICFRVMPCLSVVLIMTVKVTLFLMEVKQPRKLSSERIIIFFIFLWRYSKKEEAFNGRGAKRSCVRQDELMGSIKTQ